MDRDNGADSSGAAVGVVERSDSRQAFDGVTTSLAPRTPALAKSVTPEALSELIEEAQVKGDNLLGEYLVRSGGIEGPEDVTKVAFVAALSVARGDLTTGKSSEIRKWMELAHATMVAGQMTGGTVNYVTHLQVLAAQMGPSK
jgi:hypothetical protein